MMAGDIPGLARGGESAVTRASLSYGTRHEPRTDWAGHDTETPTEGFYRMRLRSGGVMVGVRLWFGLPRDPETLEELDRAPRWNALINGQWANVTDAWPKCAGEPVTAQEYAFLLARVDWAAEHVPDSPIADPTKRVDPLNSPLLF